MLHNNNASNKQDLNQNQLYRKLISDFPLFTKFSAQDIDEILNLAYEVRYMAGQTIVKESDFVDCFYIIVNGRAKVVRGSTSENTFIEEVFIATLTEGQSIGMSSIGFFSSSGRRTATVIALTDMLLIRIDITKFHSILKKSAFYDKNIEELSELMLKLDFIKQAYPFAQLTNEKIYTFAKQIKEITIPAETSIFKEGDVADCCYVIRHGEVEIFSKDATGADKSITILKAPELFGEAALLTSNKRNASARTLSHCRLLVLQSAVLNELLETNNFFLQSMTGLLVKRFHPVQCKNVIVHHRTTQDNRMMVTLENTDHDQYYNLSEEGWFIWQQLDGVQTVHDLTISFFKKYKAFVPEVICNLLYNLAEAGFVYIPVINKELFKEKKTKSRKEELISKLQAIMQKEFSFNRSDPVLTYLYKKGIWIFYQRRALALLLLIAISGLLVFTASSTTMMNNLPTIRPHLILFLLLLFPLVAVTSLLHEGGHAFTAKRLGYKVQRIGIGWFWFAPVAFTDTSQLWLANRGARVLVDMAGVCVDLVTAGCLALLSQLPINVEAATFLWLFSLLIYINAFRNLNPIREYDGYFILTDIADYPRLRKLSIHWLVTNYKTIYNPKALFKHLKELSYWFASIIYLIISTFLTFVMIQIIFKIFSINSIANVETKYFSAAGAIILMLLSLLGIWTEIKTYYRNLAA